MAESSSLSRFGRWLLNAIVQDVPDEIASCEFDCRKGQCRHEEWSTCTRRLENQPRRDREATD